MLDRITIEIHWLMATFLLMLWITVVGALFWSSNAIKRLQQLCRLLKKEAEYVNELRWEKSHQVLELQQEIAFLKNQRSVCERLLSKAKEKEKRYAAAENGKH